MTFRIYRTSEQFGTYPPPPVPMATRHGHNGGIHWTVDLNTIEDLVQLIESDDRSLWGDPQKRVIVSAPREGCGWKIEIWDDISDCFKYKELMMRRFAIIPGFVVLLLAVSCEREPTLADKKFNEIDNRMYLDRSTVEDVVTEIGRSADSMRRGSGEFREYVFRFDDGSSIVFVMKPAQGGGLVLDHTVTR